MPQIQARRSSDETREHVLEVAHRLFYWQGVHATGIDKIAADAAVAPTTLYRLFGSKDDLIAAYVEANAEGYRAWFTESTRPELGSPRDRILSLFDGLHDQVQPENCRGCPFLMTMAEYPAREHPAVRAAVELKSWVRDRFHALSVELEARDPAELGDRLALVFEGVYASVQALGPSGPAHTARAVAETLIDSATTVAEAA
jgi:AcrR family transcriptional regulator